jgi:hypothetical protein
MFVPSLSWQPIKRYIVLALYENSAAAKGILRTAVRMHVSLSAGAQVCPSFSPAPYACKKTVSVLSAVPTFVPSLSW